MARNSRNSNNSNNNNSNNSNKKNKKDKNKEKQRKDGSCGFIDWDWRNLGTVEQKYTRIKNVIEYYDYFLSVLPASDITRLNKHAKLRSLPFEIQTAMSTMAEVHKRALRYKADAEAALRTIANQRIAEQPIEFRNAVTNAIVKVDTLSINDIEQMISSGSLLFGNMNVLQYLCTILPEVYVAVKESAGNNNYYIRSVEYQLGSHIFYLHFGTEVELAYTAVVTIPQSSSSVTVIAYNSFKTYVVPNETQRIIPIIQNAEQVFSRCPAYVKQKQALSGGENSNNSNHKVKKARNTKRNTSSSKSK